MNNDDLRDKVIQEAIKIAELYDSGEYESCNEAADALVTNCQSGLFNEIGTMTRGLHDALNEFCETSSISNIAEDDIPDAKTRLRSVISMTEEAANKTMDAVDEVIPVAKQLEIKSQNLSSKWSRFQGRDMDANEFRAVVKELDGFLISIKTDSEKVNTLLNDILLAQGFQDLTSQIIKQVIELVTTVEDNLVKLVSISGIKKTKTSNNIDGSASHGPTVSGTRDEATAVTGQDEVDDLLASLGF